MTDTNAMREAVAQIIEPTAWKWPCASRHNREDSLSKADAILALLATDRAAGVGEAKLDLTGLSKCNKCGRHYPSAPPGVVHKCGQCRGGMCSPVEPAASPPAPADASDFSPHRWTEIISNGLGANNAGCWRCGALSEVLARVLSLSGHDAKVIQGKANGEDHVWVQIGDTVYDPTVGQFQEPVSYQMDQVAPADASGEVVEGIIAALRAEQERCDALDHILDTTECIAVIREWAALNPTAGA